MRPVTFGRATVQDAAVIEGDGQNAVSVTFTQEGATLLMALTEQASGAGSEARLLMKIGGEVRAAVAVQEPLIGDSLTIALPSGESAQEVLDLINNG